MPGEDREDQIEFGFRHVNIGLSSWLLTCYFRDALQLRHWQGDDDALGRAHPQETLTYEQAGDTHSLTFKRTNSCVIVGFF